MGQLFEMLVAVLVAVASEPVGEAVALGPGENDCRRTALVGRTVDRGQHPLVRRPLAHPDVGERAVPVGGVEPR